MKSVETLTDLIENYSENPKYSRFIEDLKKGRDWLYDIVMDYSGERVNIVGDSKDGDGFGFQITAEDIKTIILEKQSEELSEADLGAVAAGRIKFVWGEESNVGPDNEATHCYWFGVGT